ncbi:MAG: hypothetical protein HOP19_09135 [Acidobacteria bacterium]|nr:hypothetical protein [Acidobacteriota bacterium]
MYYSERLQGQQSPDVEEIGEAFWGGFVALVNKCLTTHLFAEAFPRNCFEAPYPVECDTQPLALTFSAENQEVSWPLDPSDLPNTLDALDAVEFFTRYLSKPVNRSHHSYGNHDHFLSFDREEGFREYQEAVNRLFQRCRHPYQLVSGGIERLAPLLVSEILDQDFNSQDAELNRILATAVRKYRDPDLEVRKEALEKLWDAWERIKTVPDFDKKTGINQLLQNSIPEPNLRGRIELEAKALTKIGNDFMIRHTETNKTPISCSEHVDYLFHRLFALMRLFLKYI